MTNSSNVRDNNGRARDANTALSAFILTGGQETNCDETALIDLFTNFRHLADAQGWDIDKIWQSACMHHSVERAEMPRADPSFAEFGD